MERFRTWLTVSGLFVVAILAMGAQITLLAFTEDPWDLEDLFGLEDEIVGLGKQA